MAQLSNINNALIELRTLSRIGPFLQLGVLVISAGFFIFIADFFNPDSCDLEWMIACTTIGLYAWLNPILSIFINNWKYYVAYSIIVMGLLSFSLLGLCHLLATASLANLPEFQLMLQAIFVFFFITYFLVGIFKSVIEFLKDI